ncbi:MAG TPA: BON domain-containing protein [Thermoanaerobaculia bacterium]|nr:BON domain-containing protein [Thermoanaerobaculia bacterium]
MSLKTLSKVALLGIVLLGAHAAIAAENKSDWTTTLNVKLALLDKLGSDSLNMEVDSAAGAVTLTGTVNKRETRELAQTVAKSVSGVKSVQNDVLLEASVENPNKVGVVAGETEAEVKDSVLSTKVRLVLVNKMGSDGFKIGTESASGVVTLRFNDDLPLARRTSATKAAMTVRGVKKVVAVTKAKAA